MLRGYHEGSYDKDYAKFLHESPFQSMLVCLVWWVAGSRLATFCADSGSLLLDEDIGDEIIYYRRVDGRI